MNARRPEPRPRPTYTDWPAARPPMLGPAKAGHYRNTEAGHYRNTEAGPLQEEDPAAPGLDEPGYGHGV